MKIAIAGLFDHYMYEEVCAEVLEKKGEKVVRVPFGKLAKTKLGKVEFYFTFRFLVSFYYSLKLLRTIKKEKPDILFCWRTTWLYDWVLISAKKLGIKLVSYNNDDPFSPLYCKGNIHQRRLWKHFIRQIPFYDINLVYRPVNEEEYKIAGGKNVYLWPPYYIPWEVEKASPAFDGKPIDVIFIGHWEKHREEAIQYLIDNGIDVKVFGTLWENSKLEGQIHPLYGNDYFGYIKSSKIVLAFFSRLNRDEYTRRSFEIPACGSIMLSEYSKVLKEIFKDKENVKFFSTPNEALKIIRNILNGNNFTYKNPNIGCIDVRINEFLSFVK